MIITVLLVAKHGFKSIELALCNDGYAATVRWFVFISKNINFEIRRIVDFVTYKTTYFRQSEGSYHAPLLSINSSHNLEHTFGL